MTTRRFTCPFPPYHIRTTGVRSVRTRLKGRYKPETSLVFPIRSPVEIPLTGLKGGRETVNKFLYVYKSGWTRTRDSTEEQRSSITGTGWRRVGERRGRGFRSGPDHQNT